MKHIIGVIFLVGVICARPHYVQDSIATSEDVNDELEDFKYPFQIDNTVTEQGMVEEKLIPINIQTNVVNESYYLIESENSTGYVYEVPPTTPSTSKEVVYFENSTLENHTEIVLQTTQKIPESENEDSQHKTVQNPELLNVTETAVRNTTNVIVNFADRFGTPVIITLQGSYG